MHLDEPMPHDLPRRQRATKRLPLPAPVDGEIEAALCCGICLYGESKTFADELGGDLSEPTALRADEVGCGHPAVRECELCGVRAPPTHLRQPTDDRKAGRRRLDDEDRETVVARTPGPHYAGHEVGARTTRDERLRTVDEVRVAITRSACADRRHIRAAVGFSHRK